MEPKVDLGHTTGKDYHSLYGFSGPSPISSKTQNANLGSPNFYARGEAYKHPGNNSVRCSLTGYRYEPSVASSVAMLERMEISSLPTKEQASTELKGDEDAVSSVSRRAESDEHMEGSSDSEMDEDDEIEEEEEKGEKGENDDGEENEEDDEMEEDEDEDESLSSASSENQPVTWDSSQQPKRDDYSDDDSDDDSDSTITTRCSRSVGAASVTVTPLTTPTSSPPDELDMQMNTQVGYEQGEDYYDNYDYNDDDDGEDYERDYTETGSSNPRRLLQERVGAELAPEHPLLHQGQGRQQQRQRQQQQQQRYPYPYSTLSEGDCLRAAKSSFKGQQYRRSQGDCFLALEEALMNLDEWTRPSIPLSRQNANTSRLTYQKRDLLTGGAEFVRRYDALRKRFHGLIKGVRGLEELLSLLELIGRGSREDGLDAKGFVEEELKKIHVKTERRWGPKL